MGKYIIKRLLQLIPVLIGITFLSFAMMRLAGGDAVTYMYENAGSAVSQEVIDNAKAEYGLDKPFLVQYAAWFAGMVTGDMGESYVSHRDVYETFISKLPATMMLTLSSILLTIVLAIPLGILSAVKHNKWVDYLIRFLSFIGNSMPNFFAAMVLMYFLSIRLGVLPVVTNTDLGQSIILPTLTLAISMAAKYTRQVRATVLEELNKDYVTGARARGIRSRVIIWKSVMKASMLTIITLLALSIGSLLGGTAIIESIFMWDGVGKLAVDSITMRDYPLIQAYVVWMAIFVVAPLVLVVVYAFTAKDGSFTLANFSNMNQYLGVFGNSFFLAVVATLICILVGYPLAYLLARENSRIRGAAMMLIMLPMWMNFLLRTYSWMTILENNGLLNQLFQKIGLISLYNHIFGTNLEYFPMMNTQGAVVLGMVYNYLPFMILPIYSVIIKLDHSLLEAARDLGAGSMTVFRRVILPLSLPGVVSGITMVFVPSVSTFAISRMLGGGTELLLGDLIERQFLGGAYNPQLGAAISLVMMIIVLVCMLVMNRFGEGEEQAVKL